MISERIKNLAALTVQRSKAAPRSTFFQDLHGAALGQYAGLPQWEKIARAMAHAIANMPVYIHPEDTIGGRTYQVDPLPPAAYAPDLDCDTPAREEFLSLYPEAEQLFRHYLITGTAKGHIIWDFSRILSLGVEGLRARFEEALSSARDEEAKQFYTGVLILLCYSAGLGIPFVASALLIDSLKSAFNFIKRHYTIINRICGILLILMGILMMTGLMNRFLALLS